MVLRKRITIRVDVLAKTFLPSRLTKNRCSHHEQFTMPFSLNNTMDEYTRPKTSLNTNLINSQISGISDRLSPMNGPSKHVGAILTPAPEPDWAV